MEKPFCDYLVWATAGKAHLYDHEKNRYVGKELVDALAPVFDALLDEETLRQLNHGHSTSLNESINSLIWRYCSKVRNSHSS